MSGSVRAGFSVFIRNVPWTFGKRELARYSSQFGKVLNCQLNYKKETGTHKGWGFVRFGTRDGMVKMLKERNQFIEGSFVHVSETENFK